MSGRLLLLKIIWLYLELFFLPDFSNSTNSPQSCGYDESSGEDKICCGDLNGERVITPHYPKFPQQSWKEITNGTLVFLSEARPCMDHTKYCKDWIQRYPESGLPGHESYIFMREACQESCGRCGSYVRFLFIKDD